MHLVIWLERQKNKTKALTKYLLILFLMTSFLQLLFFPSFLPTPVIKFTKVYGSL